MPRRVSPHLGYFFIAKPFQRLLPSSSKAPTGHQARIEPATVDKSHGYLPVRIILHYHLEMRPVKVRAHGPMSPAVSQLIKSPVRSMLASERICVGS